MSPTLNISLIFFKSFLVKELDSNDLQCCKYCHLFSDLSSMTTFHYKTVRIHKLSNFVSRIGMDLIQFLISHDNTHKLVHKKCHSKSYHNDIEHHIIPNTLFNVVFCFPKRFFSNLFNSMQAKPGCQGRNLTNFGFWILDNLIIKRGHVQSSLMNWRPCQYPFNTKPNCEPRRRGRWVLHGYFFQLAHFS